MVTIHPHWAKKLNAKVYNHFFKKMKGGEDKRGGCARKNKGNLIVWRLHMVPWLFDEQAVPNL